MGPSDRRAATISALLSRSAAFKLVAQKTASRELLSTPCAVSSGERSADYEGEVFNALLEGRRTLGIRDVFRCKNALVDGALILMDDRALVVEIKLRMNWTKACQAGWQVRQFPCEAAGLRRNTLTPRLSDDELLRPLPILARQRGRFPPQWALLR